MANPPEQRLVPRDGVDVVFLLVKKTINILGAILILPVGTLCVIMLVYVGLLIVPEGRVNPAAINDIRQLVSMIWTQLLPISSQILKILSPVFVLLLALAGFKLLNSDEQRAIKFGEILSDLSSLLAITIVVAICLIPFTGIEVPPVLNNIALVVVGFYFGKGQRKPTSSQFNPPGGAG